MSTLNHQSGGRPASDQDETSPPQLPYRVSNLITQVEFLSPADHLLFHQHCPAPPAAAYPVSGTGYAASSVAAAASAAATPANRPPVLPYSGAQTPARPLSRRLNDEAPSTAARTTAPLQLDANDSDEQDQVVSLPWETFSPEYTCPPTGMYIIKFRYTDGTYLLITGISSKSSIPSKSSGPHGLRDRIAQHHTAHGTAGEVTTIEGDMQGQLKRFEDINKIHLFTKRPEDGVNGTETYLCSSEEDADSTANKIIGHAEIFKNSGNLRIPLCCSKPNEGMISLDPDAPDFYKNNNIAKKRLKFTLVLKNAREKKLMSQIDESRKWLSEFQAAHGPGTMPKRLQNNNTDPKHWTQRLAKKIYNHVRAYRLQNQTKNEVHPEWVDLYREFNLKEFMLSPQDSLQSKETSFVTVRTPALRNEESTPQIEDEESAPQVEEVIRTRFGRAVQKPKHENMLQMSDDEDDRRLEEKDKFLARKARAKRSANLRNWHAKEKNKRRKKQSGTS